MQSRKMLLVAAAAVMSLGGAQAASADNVFWKIGTRFPVGDGTVTIRVGGWDHDHRHAHRCDSRCGHYRRGHRCHDRCDHWRPPRRDCAWKGRHRCDDRCGHWDRGRDHRGRGDWRNRRSRSWRGDDCDDRRKRDRRRGRAWRRR